MRRNLKITLNTFKAFYMVHLVTSIRPIFFLKGEKGMASYSRVSEHYLKLPKIRTSDVTAAEEDVCFSRERNRQQLCEKPGV